MYFSLYKFIILMQNLKYKLHQASYLIIECILKQNFNNMFIFADKRGGGGSKIAKKHYVIF